MSTRQSTSVRIKGAVHHTPGLATTYDDGTSAGHVAIYTEDGSLAIAADTPGALRSLAGAFLAAAIELEGVTAEREAVVA